MSPIFMELLKGYVATGDIKQDVYNFLVVNNCPATANHSLLVGQTSGEIALKFGVNKDDATVAGYLHDISAVFPNNERIEVARQLDIDILPEEELYPMIIHQKISKVMAEQIFHIHNKEILDAIGCHTTLRKGSTRLDRVLFVADKICWDQEGAPPYLEAIQHQLTISLDHAAFEYINYLWNSKKKH